MNWIQLTAFLLTASAEAFAGIVHPLDYDGKFEVTISKLGKRDTEVSKLFSQPFVRIYN
jgi:hypothetical protein